jgi:periplasmic protein TonB
MFEDSLVAPRAVEVSSSKRWTLLASIGLQVAVAGVVMVLPLLHPEALPFRDESPRLLMPLMLKRPVPVAQAQRAPSASSSSMAATSTTRPLIASLSPGRDTDASEAPQLAPFGSGIRMGDGFPMGIGIGDGHGPVVSVAAAKTPAERVRISSGVSQGMLIAPIRPVYPMIAKEAGVEGSVVVEAVISRDGRIESLHVVSGPPMLQNAAMDAIRDARYQPYRLNGEPTEVETRITVNFRMRG